jgi:predicted dinucleotide-binding enzyme
MKVAVLGTGVVGQALATKCVTLGYETWMGSREEGNAAAAAWQERVADLAKVGAFAQAAAWRGQVGDLGRVGTFAQAAAAADLVLLAVKGEHALAVVAAAGAALDGKVLLDITNPLDFSKGFPPRLFVCNDDSLGEQIQAAAPKAKVVKSLNTMANTLMTDPGKLPEETAVFVAGNDADAKGVVAAFLKALGHADPVDMGGIDASRGLEAWLLLWTRLYGALGTAEFNIKLVRR